MLPVASSDEDFKEFLSGDVSNGSPGSGAWSRQSEHAGVIRTSDTEVELLKAAAPSWEVAAELVGVAGFDPAASSSGSQVVASTASATSRLTWERSSVNVRSCER
jgi:hypothetical protein